MGIYKFTNKINGKIYIGMSNDIQRRYREHLYLSCKKQDTYFHQALHKYGIDNFDFQIVETYDNISREELGKREQY